MEDAKQYRVYEDGELKGYVFLTDEELKFAKQKVEENKWNITYVLVEADQ